MIDKLFLPDTHFIRYFGPQREWEEDFLRNRVMLTVPSSNDPSSNYGDPGLHAHSVPVQMPNSMVLSSKDHSVSNDDPPSPEAFLAKDTPPETDTPPSPAGFGAGIADLQLEFQDLNISIEPDSTIHNVGHQVVTDSIVPGTSTLSDSDEAVITGLGATTHGWQTSQDLDGEHTVNVHISEPENTCPGLVHAGPGEIQVIQYNQYHKRPLLFKRWDLKGVMLRGQREALQRQCSSILLFIY